MKIHENISLKDHSTMKVGGSARYLFELKDKADLPELVRFARANHLPILTIGGGSNIMFDDVGFHGLVIKIAHKGIAKKEDGEGAVVTAEAGEDWDEFVAWTLRQGLYGLENLSGIPGLVGGVPIQNVGAYGVEAGDLIASVEIFDTDDLSFRNLSAEECRFAYRDTIFKTDEGKRLIVTSVTFRLPKNPSINISYKDLVSHFKENAKPTPMEVREAVLQIRSRKFPDLKTFGTAGSFFKNVICEERFADKLKAEYPDLPAYSAGEGLKKLSTAFILDKICGLKGFREGDVGLFQNQSLVVVNFGNATSVDIKNFVEKIKKIVKEKTGIDLEEEVVVV